MLFNSLQPRLRHSPVRQNENVEEKVPRKNLNSTLHLPEFLFSVNVCNLYVYKLYQRRGEQKASKLMGINARWTKQGRRGKNKCNAINSGSQYYVIKRDQFKLNINASVLSDEYIMRVSNDATVKCSTLPGRRRKVESKKTNNLRVHRQCQSNEQQTNERMNEWMINWSN